MSEQVEQVEQVQDPVEPMQKPVDPVQEPVAPAPPAYPFSVLRVIGTALRVTKANFAPFFVLACLFEIPVALVRIADSQNVVLHAVMQLFVNSLTSAVVTYGVIMELQGSRPSTSACITTGLRQVPRVLGVTIISGILIFGAMLLLVIPGVIVMLMYFVVVPVTVVERLGIDNAMKRSRELTSGRKGDLFLVAMCGGALGLVVEIVATTSFATEPAAALAWRTVGSAFASMFTAVAAAVSYVELRKLREGTQVPELASAFARIRK